MMAHEMGQKNPTSSINDSISMETFPKIDNDILILEGMTTMVPLFKNLKKSKYK
jgi:hypothetical protein